MGGWLGELSLFSSFFLAILLLFELAFFLG